MANIDTGAAAGADGRAGDGTAAADAPLGGAKNRYNDTDHATDTPLDGAKNRYSGTDYATDPPRGAQTQRSMGQAQKENVDQHFVMFLQLCKRKIQHLSDKIVRVSISGVKKTSSE